MDISPPKYHATGFHCPLCTTYAKQTWFTPTIRDEGYTDIHNIQFCFCDRCEDFSIWRNKIMVFPDSITVPEPNEDLSEEIKSDYLEAASILQKSPRGSAALLRLAIQKLCHMLGCDSSKDINENISELVKTRGLHPTIQKALDIVRVTGNEAVHPGQIDLKDDISSAQKIFELVNFIAQRMITEEKNIGAIYESLPEEKRAAIERRDTK